MQDTERIQRLAGLLRERKDAMEIVNQIKGGRKKYAGGGKKAISSLQSDYPQKFQSMTPFVPLVPLPIRYETSPSHGLYDYPTGKEIAENNPNILLVKVPMRVNSK